MKEITLILFQNMKPIVDIISEYEANALQQTQDFQSLYQWAFCQSVQG